MLFVGVFHVNILKFFVKVLFEYMKNLLAMKSCEGDVMLPNGNNLGWERWGWMLAACVLSVGPLYQYSVM